MLKRILDELIRYKYILFLLIFTILIHNVWFSFDNILTSTDWRYWFNESAKEAYYSITPWIGFFHFGYFNVQMYLYFHIFLFSLLANLGFESGLTLKIVYLIPVSIMGFLSPYILVKRLVKNNFIAFVSALFYGTTTYFICRQTAHLYIAFIYSIAPLIFYFFISALSSNKTKDWIYFFLISFVGICYEARIMFIVFFILLFYFIFFHVLEIKKYCRALFLFFCSLLFFNSFWLIPTLLGGSQAGIEEITARGLFGNHFFSLTNSFTIQEYAWTGGEIFAFVKQPVIWYFWFIPLFAFSTFLFKKAKYKKELLFFGILSLVGIFLTKQSSEPFTGVYLWLYNNFPGFSLFREASKLYLVTSLGYLGLISYGLSIFKESKNIYLNKYLFYFFSFLFIGIAFINVKPLYTGEMKRMFVPREIPKDYLVFKDFLFNQESFFRTVWVPVVSRWGFFSNSFPRVSFVDMLNSSWSAVSDYSSPKMKRIAKEEAILNIYNKNFADELFDISLLKYIVIPINEKENDIYFFDSYGGRENPGVRQSYIEKLNEVSWLKKIDIGTKDLVVYENEDYKPPIFAFDNLFGLNYFSDIDKKYDLASSKLKKEFYFTVADKKNHDGSPLSPLFGIFENISADNIGKDISSIFPGLGQRVFNLYKKNTNGVVFYSFDGDKAVFYTKERGVLSLNGINVSGADGEKDTIRTFWAIPGEKYYISEGGTLSPLVNGKDFYFGDNKNEKTIKIFSAGENILKNGSFEEGLWQEKVGDCNRYDNNSIMSMSLDKKNKTDGENSLRLEATTHIACTLTRIPIVESGKYVFGFDYQSSNSKISAYHLRFNDADKTLVNGVLPIGDNKWHSFLKEIDIPPDATSATLHIYAYSSDGLINNIVRYDNFELRELYFEKKLIIPAERGEFKKSKIEMAEGGNVFKYESSFFDYKNLFANGSFEEGLWQEKVGDCNNYDKEPVIAMSLSEATSSDRRRSLQLEAARHIACTGTATNIDAGSTYFFIFDYQSDNSNTAGYHIGFNDKKKTVIAEKITVKDKNWNTFSNIIKAPEGATAFSLNVYAYSKNEKERMINRYDNFKLIKIPDLIGSYYLVGDPSIKIENPASVAFELINPTKKLVHIKGASTPFFLAMSESYHPKWQLQMNNDKVNGFFNSWMPFVVPDKVSDDRHYKLNDFLNAWYVDTGVMCHNNSACVKNEDGSYDIELVVEFFPQRWFYLGLLISGMTLTGCIGYLTYEWRKNKKQIV